MKKILIVSLAAVCAFSEITAQRTYEYKRLRIGAEAGFESYFGSNVKPSAIRESQPYYRYDYYDHYFDCGYLYDKSDFTTGYVGIKSVYSLGHHLDVGAGIRFSFGESSLRSNLDYFLWKIEDNETFSNYIRLKNINQNTYGVGIPLELKVYPGKSDVWLRLYGKAGVVFNFIFTEDISVEFANEAMKKYLSEIKNRFDKPHLFNGQFVLGIGFKIGRMKNPFGTIELLTPIQFNDKTRLNSLFKLNNRLGIGMQATIYIPAGKQKLSYQY